MNGLPQPSSNLTGVFTKSFQHGDYINAEGQQVQIPDRDFGDKLRVHVTTWRMPHGEHMTHHDDTSAADYLARAPRAPLPRHTHYQSGGGYQSARAWHGKPCPEYGNTSVSTCCASVSSSCASVSHDCASVSSDCASVSHSPDLTRSSTTRSASVGIGTQTFSI